MTLTEMIEENLADTRMAYNSRMGKVSSVAYAERKLAEVQQELVTARHSILTGTDPKELGANEAIRSARIAELTADAEKEVTMQQDCLRKLQTELEVIRLECRRCDLTLQHLALLK